MSNNQLAIVQKDITEQVNGKLSVMEKEGLRFPKNYNPSNALKSAFFAMTNSQSGNLLEKCSKDSIANSLLNMVVQGLNPAKNQCYFIPYGDKATLNRSYFGTQAVLKRLDSVKDVWANVIYEGDTFEIAIEKGKEVLKEHKTSFMNRDNKILGAYCIIEKTDGEQVLTVMTKKEIDASWSKAKTKNVQNQFPQEMAKRTVINRAAKPFINASDDSDLLSDYFNRTTEGEYQNEHEIKEAEVIEEIKENANSEEFEIIEESTEPVNQKEPETEVNLFEDETEEVPF